MIVRNVFDSCRVKHSLQIACPLRCLVFCLMGRSEEAKRQREEFRHAEWVQSGALKHRRVSNKVLLEQESYLTTKLVGTEDKVPLHVCSISQV